MTGEIGIEEYKSLGYRYRDAIRERYKDVIKALRSTEKPWPDSDDLYKEVDLPPWAKTKFSTAANGLTELGYLEVHNKESVSSYNWAAIDMTGEELDQIESDVESLLESF